ncbi:DUF1294 domain-containing protein [Novosphingobium panipatense]|uniref:DUF1294 domain-containing protein n=1 Tax=Novosphingobium TaxID=165696 RepID=UPI000CDA0AD1|nr:DUF1294 domain-containing protein [Novosphingobium sp. HII-3]
MLSSLHAAAMAVAALNLAAFTAFGLDKTFAKAGRRRISESTLLALAVLGGSPGAYAARRLFRHKTRKQPFVAQLHAIALLQGVLLAGLAWAFLSAGS